MQFGGCRTAHHDRDGQASFLHFVRYMHHLFQRRRDQAGQANQIRLFFDRCLYNDFGRNHHTQVDHLIIVAGQHDRYDVLSDIVHVALHGCKDYLSCFCRTGSRFLRLDSRLQDGDSLFHGTGGLYHLRQEHFTGTEQFADFIHAAHQRTVDDIYGTRIFFQGFRQVFFQMVADPFYQGIFETLLQRLFPPGFLFFFCSALLFHMQVLSIRDELLGCFRTTVQDHIFQQVTELRFYIFIKHG